MKSFKWRKGIKYDLLIARSCHENHTNEDESGSQWCNQIEGGTVVNCSSINWLRNSVVAVASAEWKSSSPFVGEGFQLLRWNVLQIFHNKPFDDFSTSRSSQRSIVVINFFLIDWIDEPFNIKRCSSDFARRNKICCILENLLNKPVWLISTVLNIEKDS